MSGFDAFARYYDADYGLFDEDIPFYSALARRCTGPIIELMCGSGRLLVPLAQAGHRVTGVDISAAFLAQAREKIARIGASARVEFVQSDICVAVPAGPFGLAIVALNSFMHLTSIQQQLAALQHIFAALRPGALLVLDLFNPDLRALVGQTGEVILDKTFALPNGTEVQKFVVQRTDMAAQINEVIFIYDEIDAEGYLRRASLPFAMRWFYRYELEHLLVRSGFAIEAIYGSYELESYANESDLMLVVARRT